MRTATDGQLRLAAAPVMVDAVPDAVPKKMDRDPVRFYLARLSAGSRPAMASALDRVAAIASGGRRGAACFPWQALRYPHVQVIRVALVESPSPRTGRPLSPASVNKILSALRGVLREAWRLGLLSAEELARATDVEPVRGSVPLRGRALKSREVAALFAACQRDPSPSGRRDAAVLALGLGAGLRRAEIAGLDLADVELGREVVTVRGKGRRVREVPIKGGTLRALRAWLEVRGQPPGPLLWPVRRGGQLGARRLAAHAVLRVCEKRGRQAGVPNFTAHDLRRTYISTVLDAGADLAVASELAGHAGPGTTKRYDRRGERARERAAEAVFVPVP